jgi:hypothetical protein
MRDDGLAVVSSCSRARSTSRMAWPAGLSSQSSCPAAQAKEVGGEYGADGDNLMQALTIPLVSTLGLATWLHTKHKPLETARLTGRELMTH